MEVFLWVVRRKTSHPAGIGKRRTRGSDRLALAQPGTARVGLAGVGRRNTGKPGSGQHDTLLPAAGAETRRRLRAESGSDTGGGAAPTFSAGPVPSGAEIGRAHV